jgi:hypothetical protein
MWWFLRSVLFFYILAGSGKLEGLREYRQVWKSRQVYGNPASFVRIPTDPYKFEASPTDILR